MKQKLKLTVIIICSSLFLTGSFSSPSKFNPNIPTVYAIPGESAGHTNY